MLNNFNKSILYQDVAYFICIVFNYKNTAGCQFHLFVTHLVMGCLGYYLYVVAVMSSPTPPNAYTIILENCSFILSFLQFHFFRAYLRSGPPSTKTVVHGLLITFTYLFQASEIYGYMLSTLGYFPDLMESFLHSNPDLLCSITSPRVVFLLCLYLMYLAFFRLLMVVKMDMFVNLKHETIVTRLNIISCIIMLFVVGCEYLWEGTICKPETSSAFLTFWVGFPVNATDISTTERMPSPSAPLALVTISIAIGSYALSFVIKEIQNDTQNNPERYDQHNSSPIAFISKIFGNYAEHSRVSEFSGPLDSENVNIEPPMLYLGEHQPSQRNDLPILPGQVEESPASVARSGKSVEDDLQASIRKSSEATIHIPKRSKLRINLVAQDGYSGGPSTLGQTDIPMSQHQVIRSQDVSTPSSDQDHILASNVQHFMQKTFLKVSFTTGIAFFIFLLVSKITKMQSSWALLIISRIIIYVYDCLPMYWLLMIEDCFNLSCRRVKAFLAEKLHIYLE